MQPVPVQQLVTPRSLQSERHSLHVIVGEHDENDQLAHVPVAGPAAVPERQV